MTSSGGQTGGCCGESTKLTVARFFGTLVPYLQRRLEVHRLGEDELLGRLRRGHRQKVVCNSVGYRFSQKNRDKTHWSKSHTWSSLSRLLTDSKACSTCQFYRNGIKHSGKICVPWPFVNCPFRGPIFQAKSRTIRRVLWTNHHITTYNICGLPGAWSTSYLRRTIPVSSVQR